MAIRRTTICCSAVALVAAWCVNLNAQTATARTRPAKQTRAADDKSPLQLFPIDTLWTLSLNNALTAAPAFDDTRAFFPLEGEQFTAYDLVGRQRLWIARVGTTVEPVAAAGVVYVVEAMSIVALRATDGDVVWRVPFTETAAVPPTLAGEWLLIATTAGDVVSRRTRDGAVVWQEHLSMPAHARPTVQRNRVFVPTSDAQVVALDRDTGKPIWMRRLGGPGNEILATDERLYLGSEDRYFYCLNASTGAVEWRWPTGANVIGHPVIDDQTVYFVSLDNVLRGLNRSSGVQRWKSALPLRPSTGALKSSETLIVVGAAPGIRAYSAKDGKPAGEAMTASELWAPPSLFSDPALPLPVLLAVTSDITGRAMVTASTRTVEPAIKEVGPLPDSVQVPPAVDLPEDLGPVIPLPNLFPMTPATGP